MARKDFQPRDKNFSQFPLLWLAVCFAAGISAAHSVNISFYLWLLLLFVATTGAVWFFLEKKHLQSTVSLFFAFTVAGAFSVAAEKQTVGLNRISQIYDTGEITFQTPVVLMGALASEPEQTPNGYFLTLQAEQIEFNENMRAASGRVRLFLPLDTPQAKREYETLALRYGAKVKAVTRLTREDRFRNPGGTNYKKILETKNLEATGALRNVASVQKISDFEGFDLSGWIYRWRAALVKQFAQNFSIQTAGVLSASLLNNRYFLDKSTASRFREGGTFHVLVISGVHITFIGFLIIWSVRKITRRHAAQFIAANVLLWTYTIAVGAETPVVRAALMFTIFHAATLVYRQNVSLNALGATALLLLIARPSDLFDQSFQLTFLSVGAIVAVAFPILEKMREIGSWQLSEQTPVPPTCAKWLKTLCETLFWNEQSWQHAQARTVWKARLFKSKFAGKLVRLSLQAAWQTVFSAVFVSVVVAICLLPLMAIYFHRLSIASVFLNVFVGFLIAVESLVGVWALLVAQISGTLAAPFIAWTEWCNFLLIASAEPFIERNLASVRLPIYTGARSAIYWLYYLPLVFLAIAAHGWNPFELRKTENGEWKTENKKIMLL